jgi:hypothetical protein
MPEIVRLVSDGDEMLLSEGEAFRIHPDPDEREPAVDRGSGSPLAGPLGDRKVPEA